MDFALSGELKDVPRRVREFVEQEIVPLKRFPSDLTRRDSQEVNDGRVFVH